MVEQIHGLHRFAIFRYRRFLSQLLLSASLLLAGINTGYGASLLTLEEAVRLALKNNPNLQAWRYQRDAQSLEKDIARGLHYPTLQIGASYSHYSDPSLIHPISEVGAFPPFSTDIVKAGLSLRLPLYAGGKLVAGEQLAAYNEQETIQQLRQSEQDLIFNLVSTYAKALQLSDLIKAQSQRLRSLAAQANDIVHKRDEGQATRLDSLRIKAQLSQARVDHVATVQGEQDALDLLAALINQPGLDRPLTPTPSMRLIVPRSIENITRLAEEKNPRIVQARSQLKSAESRVEIARADRRMQVDLLANTQTRRGDDWEGRDDWDIGVAISIPLFDGGVRRSRIDQANAQLLRARQVLQNTLNEVRTEARAALGSLNTAGAQVEAARQAVDEAQEAMRIEALRYGAGRSTVTNLLSAESASWSAIASLNQANFDGFVAQVRLLRSLGELKPTVFEGSASVAQPAGEPIDQ